MRYSLIARVRISKWAVEKRCQVVWDLEDQLVWCNMIRSLKEKFALVVWQS